MADQNEPAGPPDLTLAYDPYVGVLIIAVAGPRLPLIRTSALGCWHADTVWRARQPDMRAKATVRRTSPLMPPNKRWWIT